MSKQAPRFATFAELLAALNAGNIPRERVELCEYTSSCAVAAHLRREDVNPIDGRSGDDVLLYRTDTLETFLLDVAKALGVEGNIW